MPRSDSHQQQPATGRIHPPIGKLTDALSFRIARLAAVNDRAGSAHFREAHGLRLSEWRVLGLTQELQPVDFDRLRRMLVMDKGQLSRTVKALVDRRLIVTVASDTDARKVELRTTPAGADLHDRVLAFTQERNEAMVGSLTPAECAELLRLITKLTAHNNELALLAGHLK